MAQSHTPPNQSRVPRETRAKGGIRQKILIIFVVFSVICLFGIMALATGFFLIIQDTTTDRSEAALVNQIQTNMQTSADENALVIEEQLAAARANVERAVLYAEQLFNNPTEFGVRQSFNDTVSPLTPGLGALSDADYGQYVSFNYSCYHLAPGVYAGSYDTANANVQNVVTKSANLDLIFQYLKQQNPEYGWIYMGFPQGVHRSYPWHSISTQYDPRARSWYAAATANPGEVQITAPYIDSSGLGLMVSLAKTAYYTNGTLLGVLALDLTIDAIVESVLDISILDTGYAYLIDTQGNTVAHENSTSPDTPVRDLEPGISTTLLTQMTTNTKGLSQVQKGGQTYYLAYSRVNSTNFVLVNAVPESEVVAPVAQLSVEIQKASTVVIYGTIVIIVVALVISVIVGTSIAGKITRPVQKLTRVVRGLTQLDVASAVLKSDETIQLDERLEQQNDEIGDLTRAFKKMLNTIKQDARDAA